MTFGALLPTTGADVDVASIYTVLFAFASARIYQFLHAAGAAASAKPRGSTVPLVGLVSLALFPLLVRLGFVSIDEGFRTRLVAHAMAFAFCENGLYFAIVAVARQWVSVDSLCRAGLTSSLTWPSAGFFLASLCSVGLGYWSRETDSAMNRGLGGFACDPHAVRSFFQLHAAWHVLCAFSLFFAWLVGIPSGRARVCVHTLLTLH